MTLRQGTIILCSLVGAVIGQVTYIHPTAEEPCGSIDYPFPGLKISTIEDADIFNNCTSVKSFKAGLYIDRNYPGHLSIPNLEIASSIYIGDDQPGTVGGTLTGVTFPALKSLESLEATNLDGLLSIVIPKASGSGLTLVNLPALEEFSSPIWETGFLDHMNITNTGIESFVYHGTNKDVFSLSGNRRLSAVSFPSNVSINDFKLDCQGAPAPHFSDGPGNIKSFKVKNCGQPAGDWRTAFPGIKPEYVYGSTIDLVDNMFTSIGFPNLTHIGDLNIERNPHLTDISFASLEEVGNDLSITDNNAFLELKDTSFPSLQAIIGIAKFNGTFVSITWPPNLYDAQNVRITSTSKDLNCSSYSPGDTGDYVCGFVHLSTPSICVYCSNDPEEFTYTHSGGSSGDSDDDVSINLKPRYIAAIVVSAVGTVFWIILIWWLCVRRRNRRRRRKAEIAALQSQVDGLRAPIHALNGAQQADNGGSKDATVSTEPASQYGAANEPIFGAPSTAPTSTVVSREEELDARERTLQAREREEELDRREQSLLARERELEARRSRT